jgi:hypothetical protein
MTAASADAVPGPAAGGCAGHGGIAHAIFDRVGADKDCIVVRARSLRARAPSDQPAADDDRRNITGLRRVPRICRRDPRIGEQDA